MLSLHKQDPSLEIMNNSLVEMPAPKNISAWWNFGSLLGVCLGSQIITGLLLSLHFINCADYAFSSVIHISQDVDLGWLVRYTHTNGASVFFIGLYLHIGRGLYYGSFRLFHVWSVGVSLFLLVMATAFLGYVLPWGQMSFWGATVITNLVSTMPIYGQDLVQWLWGGFAVGGATLTRFFALHYLLPMVISALVLIHIMYLHQTGSGNPVGLEAGVMKESFHPFYSIKDTAGIITVLAFFMLLSLLAPFILGDPENFNEANPLSTPLHIQPEWYYLFAYAILRSIPNKLGGVISLLLSVLVLYTIPLTTSKIYKSNQSYPLGQVLFWSFVTTAVLLTWIGARPVEMPYILVGQILTLSYFMYFFMNPLLGGGVTR
uniref:Cytochrome b n=1 Tax=Proasellus hercegovinensis TaxID=1281977 RepID=A0A485M8V7_9CRUS|nr:Cytochrome b oxydase [Proasellus hercegovinensis]